MVAVRTALAPIPGTHKCSCCINHHGNTWGKSVVLRHEPALRKTDKNPITAICKYLGVCHLAVCRHPQTPC